MKFLLVHCWGGDGRSCWSGWLGDELRVSGLASSVLSPDLPNTNEPKLDEWVAEIRKHVKRFDGRDGWILVGHSLGCPTILRMLERFGEKEKIRAAILVAAFAKDLGISEIRNFVDGPFDWEKIKKKCGRFIVINSDNDPFIELGEGKRISKLLDSGPGTSEFMTEHNAGHINEGAGFTKYERLVEIIKRALSERP